MHHRPSFLKRLRNRRAHRPAALIALLALLLVGGLLLLRSSPVSGAPLREAKLVGRTLTAIDRHYYDASRIDARNMLRAALERVENTVPEVLVRFDGTSAIDVTVGLASKRFRTRRLANLSDLDRTLREVLAFIDAHYTGDEPKEEIEYTAIDGMLQALDPHSNFLPPKIYEEFKVGTRGKFGGLGIVISIRDGWLTVIAPLDGTPAARAGVQAGDRILQIDGESTINLSLMDAVNKLRGEVGTKVTIVLERKGRPERTLTFTRALINIDSVQHALLTRGEKRIGYIKIKNFQANTDEDVGKALAALEPKGKKLHGLILDLRNNPGGLLDISADIADRFLRKGIIVSTLGPRDRLIDEERANAKGTQPDYPIVTLINEGSASASEILAGALQVHDRGVVMGRHSFGKGSVQTIFELGDDAAIKLTIAQYMAGGTESIQLDGLVPDIEVVPATVDRQEIDLVEDTLPSEKDLEAHLERDRGRKEGVRRALIRVSFLKPREDEDAAERRALEEYAKKPKVEEDFTAKLAADLLAQAGSPSRKQMLADALVPLRAAQRQEEEKIAKAFEALGVNWSVAPREKAPAYALSSRLLSGGKPISRARAGTTVDLELTVTNTGTGTASQLIAVGQSEEAPFLANREFAFGLLPPKQKRSWRVPIEIPEGIATQRFTMEVAFREAHGEEKQSVDVIVPVAGEPRPAFGVTYRLGGARAGKPVTLKAPLSLALTVTNVGKGPSGKETAATLVNDCGEHLFIQRGRETIGRLAPGGTRSARFRFTLNGTVPDEGCVLELGVTDLKRFSYITERITLDEKTATLSPPAGVRYQPPSISIAPFPSITDAASLTLTGTIEDTDSVKDAYVFVGEQKIAYLPNAAGGKRFPFSITIPLEPGNNRVLIAARDAQELTGRRLIVIERTGATTTAASNPPSTTAELPAHLP